MSNPYWPHGVRSGPRLIALYSSSAQSGKSAVARDLISNAGAMPVKFAGPLKRMTATLLAASGVSPEDIERMTEGDLKEAVVPALGVSPRRLMQTLGTEWGRDILAQDFWTKPAMATARRYMEDLRAHVVIDDMRFPNEYDAIRAMGGEVWRVTRPGAPASLSSHQSEGLLDGHAFDWVVENKGTLRDLTNGVWAAWNSGS